MGDCLGFFVVDTGTETNDVLTIYLRCQIGECMRHQFVVAVDKKDIVALCIIESSVAGCGHTLVLLVDDLHLWVAFQQSCRAIDATVVDDDDFIVCELLREDAVETPLQVGFGVIGGYDDGKTH